MTNAKKKHSHHFCTKTMQCKDSNLIYCRRNDNRQVFVRNATLDNCQVVPYNSHISM